MLCFVVHSQLKKIICENFGVQEKSGNRIFSVLTIKMKLPPMLSVGDIIKLYGLSAKQKLSQNFLLNMNITGKRS
jgi:hypothetical protein